MSDVHGKYYAIQLSPELHQLITIRLSKLGDLTELQHFLSNTPIYRGMHVIIFGDFCTYKLLDKRQYELRKNQNHLLKQYRTVMHNHIKFLEKDELMASELLIELKRLSQRINILDQQMNIKIGAPKNDAPH